jgi:ATP-dependent HslUV protease ATP-binding subunit HslU
MQTEQVDLTFTPDAVEMLASYAYRVNQTTQNIGARRLYTILEHLLEELSFAASEMPGTTVSIDTAYVRQRLQEVTDDENLSRFIL